MSDFVDADTQSLRDLQAVSAPEASPQARSQDLSNIPNRSTSAFTAASRPMQQSARPAGHRPVTVVALSACDLKRLEQLLGMLGSAYLGDRDNAGQMAHRMVKNAGMTWGEIINAKAPVIVVRPPPKPPRSWRQVARECSELDYALSDWEQTFLASILQRSKPLSPRQQ